MVNGEPRRGDIRRRNCAVNMTWMYVSYQYDISIPDF